MTKQNEKDAKRVPELRFKGFTDDWEQRKLGEIATIVGGGTPSTKNPEYWDGDINWYSPAEIGNQIYTEKSERQITELGLKKSSAKLLPVGTVLFTSRAGIGKTAILNKEACTNQGFQSIIPRSKMLNSYFLFSRTNSLKQYGETMGSGSTFVEVSGKQMSKMPLFIPNINEQSKIAKLFQSLDRTITLHEEKQRQLERLKKALLQKMFADKTGYPALRFKGFTEKWEQRKLGEIAEEVKGNSGSINNIPILTISAANGWMNQKDRFSQIIAGNELKKYTLLKKGELSYNHGNSKLAKYGTVFVQDSHDKALVPRVYHSFKMVAQNNPYFIEYLFASGLPNKELSKIVTSGARMDGLLNINKKEFFSIKLNNPSSEEQSSVAKLFQSLDKTITLHDKKIQYLKQLKRGLLQKMFV